MFLNKLCENTKSLESLFVSCDLIGVNYLIRNIHKPPKGNIKLF